MCLGMSAQHVENRDDTSALGANMTFIAYLSSCLSGPFRRSSHSNPSYSLQSPLHKTAYEALQKGQHLIICLPCPVQMPRLSQVLAPSQKRECHCLLYPAGMDGRITRGA